VLARTSEPICNAMRAAKHDRRWRSRAASTVLSGYRSKRRFEQTPEPRGHNAGAKGHPYAIQKHAARSLHYDLRLELDGVLKSSAVTKGPSLSPRDKRLGVRTEDHPSEYADLEGRIPEGNYGAGAVMLWDRGRMGTDRRSARGARAREVGVPAARQAVAWTLGARPISRRARSRTGELAADQGEGRPGRTED
jgi:DNA ligase D-like protein (predicted 3'-phosphoesterase)